MKTFNHTRPVRDANGNELHRREAPAFRLTVATLGGGFCRDSERRLVVGLEAGDLITFRPEGTRQKVSFPAKELFRWVLWNKANAVQLAKARERKARLADARIEAKRIRAERKLTREARAMNL